MNLTIDIGNTQTKLGIFDGLELKSTQKFSSTETIPWQSILDTHKITHSILSQVGNVQSDLKMLYNNTQCVEVHHQLQLPFSSNYDPFENLGIDRVVGLATAAYLFPRENVLIIDAGTCITYDLMTAKAHHLGGVISPGLMMRYQAMHRFTHQLPNLEIQEPSSFPPTNTHEAIHHGVISSVIAEIKAFISRFETSIPTFRIILTGGNASFLSKRVKNGILADENFLAIGLNLLLETNKS
ncbi:MAG: type III pantothenate kinase [Flavobacteriaceae bacterium]|nr:type III pantothenate kinase [Flavobacteriaceae bacterium]